MGPSLGVDRGFADVREVWEPFALDSLAEELYRSMRACDEDTMAIERWG